MLIFAHFSFDMAHNYSFYYYNFSHHKGQSWKGGKNIMLKWILFLERWEIAENEENVNGMDCTHTYMPAPNKTKRSMKRGRKKYRLFFYSPVKLKQPNKSESSEKKRRRLHACGGRKYKNRSAFSSLLIPASARWHGKRELQSFSQNSHTRVHKHDGNEGSSHIKPV